MGGGAQKSGSSKPLPSCRATSWEFWEFPFLEIVLDHWFLTGAVSPPEDIEQCPETFLAATTWGLACLWEAKDAALTFWSAQGGLLTPHQQRMIWTKKH